jgi:N4-gp56 family major capsid protein
MAKTDFASGQGGAKVLWSRKLWSDARDLMFMSKFEGGADAPVHMISELTKEERGETVKMQLVSDLIGDGIVGDGEREGRGEQLKNYYDEITIDIISHSVENTGKLSDQKSVINFREQANDKLKYWLANRMDQLKILTLSGVSYAYNLDGSTRSESSFANLAFAGDVSAPTVGRHYRVTADASGVYTGLAAGDTASVDATDVLSYKAIVDAGVKARRNYMPGMMKDGKDYYVAMVSPEGYAQLKKDSDFQNAIVSAGNRGEGNPWFTGGIVTIDGLVFHEHRLVYNTLGATSGSAKWGAGSDVDGSRMLLMGRQALGYVDLGAPSWVEKMFQYDSMMGINVDKMFGLLKPKFYNVNTGRVEDFGVMAIDHAI